MLVAMSTIAPTRSFDLPARLSEPPAAVFYGIIKAIASSGGIGIAVNRIDRGQLRVLSKVEAVLTKAAVGAASLGALLSDPGDASIRSGFFASLRSKSVFFRLFDNGMMRAPFYSRIAVVASKFTATGILEGKATPVNAVSLDKATLVPQKVGAMVVATQELVAATTGSASDLFAAELTAAAAEAVDEAFLAALAGDITTVATAGTKDADLAAALTAIAKTGNESLLWVAAPDVAILLALDSLAPDAVSPTGGVVAGIPLMVSDALAPGSLLLLDASAIIGNSDELDLAVSVQADVQSDSAPTIATDTPTGANMVSLFQTNSVATKIVVALAAAAARSPCGHMTTAITWTGP